MHDDAFIFVGEDQFILGSQGKPKTGSSDSEHATNQTLVMKRRPIKFGLICWVLTRYDTVVAFPKINVNSNFKRETGSELLKKRLQGQ